MTGDGAPGSVRGMDVRPTLVAGAGEVVVLVVEVDGGIAGGIEYSEETDPQYRHAGVDIYRSWTCCAVS